MGCVPPEPGFLEAIVELCKEHGALSIFDEVMTGCRVARGRRAGALRSRPDMTCLGKVIGGGMPLAAYGGREDVMNVDRAARPGLPSRHAQRKSGRGERGARDARASRRRRSTRKLEATRRRARGAARRAPSPRRGVAARVQRVGSMLTVFFRKEPVRSWADAAASDTEAVRRLARGATLARRLLAAVAIRSRLRQRGAQPRRSREDRRGRVPAFEAG